MRIRKWLLVGMFALGALGCEETSEATDAGAVSADAGDAGKDGGGDSAGDAGAPGRQPRSGIASTGEPPTGAPDHSNGTTAGDGDTATDTRQDGDDGDAVWTTEEDVNGDGSPEAVTSLLDDETGTFYVWYMLTKPDCTTFVMVIFDGDGSGNEGDGEGRYFFGTTCDETDELLGCEFDASGAETECGVCAQDELDHVWQCEADPGDPFECVCDVDATTCSDGCLCDLECIEMCLCDVDTTCSDGCECDFECVFGECECDVDLTCTDGCECDVECDPNACLCDVDFDCTPDCACDVEC